MDDTKVELKCAQINLQHARVATANLMKYIADMHTGAVHPPRESGGNRHNIQNIHSRGGKK
jgi:hypothetical protein